MSLIKTIIFDLDDTLVDTTSQLKGKAHKQAFRAMQEKGLTESGNTVLPLLDASTFSGKEKFTHLVLQLNCSLDLVNVGYEAYTKVSIGKLFPLPGVNSFLRELKKSYELILVTMGDKVTQQTKIDALNIRQFFSRIIICSGDKTEAFSTILYQSGNNSLRFMVVGDSLKNEIASGKLLGMHTVHIGSDVSSVVELPAILDEINGEL